MVARKNNSPSNILSIPDLVITRLFAAPRDLVWQTWTDPQHIMKWWGPKGYSNSSCELELTVGGEFSLSMSAPDGKTYPCKGIYREIKEPERIVYDSIADESNPCGAGLPPRSIVTITFTEHGDKTKLVIHTRFESVERRAATLQAGYSIGWGESLERLAAILNNL